MLIIYIIMIIATLLAMCNFMATRWPLEKSEVAWFGYKHFAISFLKPSAQIIPITVCIDGFGAYITICNFSIYYLTDKYESSKL